MSATQCEKEHRSPKTPESQAEEPRRADSGGRDERGRFTAGNVGGPGNPFARRVAAYRQVLHDCVSIEDMRCLAEQLLALGKLGDLAAIKLLLQYIVGKPAATVDPDSLDLQEIALFLRGPTAEDVHALTSGQRMPPDAWMAMLRVCLPLVVRKFHDVFLNMFERTDAAQAAGETPDTDEIVEAAIDEVLGRTEEDEWEQPPTAPATSGGEAPSEQAPAIDGNIGDDPRPLATGPSPNGHSNGSYTRQKTSANGGNEGLGTLPPLLERCPMCRR
jgi:hypothetical protein